MNLQLDQIKIRNGTGVVVRDDLLRGGTKERAIIPFVEKLKERGYTHFVYASPFSGFAQIALASTIEKTGIACTIFAETMADSELHEFSLRAEAFGAKIVSCANLDQAETSSAEFASRSASTYKIPLGFNEPRYRACLKAEIEKLWPELHSPSRLWLPVGSGTLVNVFREVAPPETQIHCVDVHVLGDQDSRIRGVLALPNTSYYSARQAFHDECEAQCPVPSNAYYDRKVFEVFSREGRDGDVWWNVAH